MASQRAGFSRDDQVLEAIFNPENPVGGLEVSLSFSFAVR